jgi:hypothetical protein
VGHLALVADTFTWQPRKEASMMPAFHARRFSAGRRNMHLRRDGEIAGGEARCRIDQMLATVEDEEQALVAHMSRQARQWGVRPSGDTERRRHRRGNHGRSLQRAKVDEHNGTSEILGQRVPDRPPPWFFRHLPARRW